MYDQDITGVRGFQRHRLVRRGEWGLACDERGLAIGPIELIVRDRESAGGPAYRCVTPKLLEAVGAAIYGDGASQAQQWFSQRLIAIANAMSKGQHAFARIAAAHLRLSNFSAARDARLRKLFVSLQKYNPNWPDEPRDEGGRWSSDSGNPVVPVIAPYSPECLEAIAQAKRICIDRYTAAGGGLGPVWMTRCIRSYVPDDCGY